MNTALQKINIDGFKALVFRMQSTLFAADLEQIDELLVGDRWNHHEEDVILLDRLIPLGTSPLVYQEPHVITINYQGSKVSIQIDKPEDITYITIDAIRSFPIIVDKVRQHLWLWGVGLLKEEPVLLIDFHKLAANCLSEQEAAWK